MTIHRDSVPNLPRAGALRLVKNRPVTRGGTAFGAYEGVDEGLLSPDLAAGI